MILAVKIYGIRLLLTLKKYVTKSIELVCDNVFN